MGVDSFPKVTVELSSIFQHLPLPTLKNLAVFFETSFDSVTPQPEVDFLITTMESMRFPALESFYFGFGCDVHDVPDFDLWVECPLHHGKSS